MNEIFEKSLETIVPQRLQDLEFGALDTKIRQIPSGKFVTSFVAGVTRFSGVLRKTAGTSVLSKNLVYSSFPAAFAAGVCAKKGEENKNSSKRTTRRRHGADKINSSSCYKIPTNYLQMNRKKRRNQP